MSQPVPSFGELLASCQHSAVHLEMRDVYYSTERFTAWQHGERVDWSDRSSWWSDFSQQTLDAVERGVVVRRARIISQPPTDYVRWEHYVTVANVAAGEQVRWLPRRRATDLSLPSNDFWLFDGDLLRVHHFSGDGAIVEDEITRHPGLVAHCATAFEAVWERAAPHETFQL